VAERHHAREVEAVDLRELVDARADVVGRLRPPATVPDPAVLEVPGGPALLRERRGERTAEREVVLRAPEPAVDDDDHPA
jgi:hypothetical protein